MIIDYNSRFFPTRFCNEKTHAPRPDSRPFGRRLPRLCRHRQHRRNNESYASTLPTVKVVGQADTSVLKGYINYDEAAVTRNGQLIKETPQTVDTLNI